MKVAVIGAGIVGLSTANWLQNYNQETVLYDMNEPGSQTSFGNAGTYAQYANIPTNSPSFMYLFPYLLFSRNSPLFIKLKYFPKLLPWLYQFLKNSKRSKVNDTSDKLTVLLKMMENGYQDLFRDAECTKYLTKESILYLWSNKYFFSNAKKDFAKRMETGSKITILDKNQVSEIEPNIKNIFCGGALFEGSYFANDPKKISESLLKLFIDRGGLFKKEEVLDIVSETNQITLKTTESTETFDKIVICAGIWSKNITAKIGENVPLEAERGYHLMYPELSNIIKRPISWQERGVYFTPMSNGLRTAGTVEFAGLSAIKSQNVINFLDKTTRSVFRDVKQPSESWLGFRPSVPDSVPVIGQSEKNPYIYYCFGHQHVGWTLGGISGKLIAQQMSANKVDIDLSPYSLKRFKN
ncbi:MAG: FAD-dependent oxidoreductase [Rhodobiaceae bacterium]|nr:FAD-dependent oxidoreductase [Rhodobiaceae bacterium]|tara:strand:+ start:6206 stop:7438 length:1233 start_codon:yes stop_codon:yes gene_type:complete